MDPANPVSGPGSAARATLAATRGEDRPPRAGQVVVGAVAVVVVCLVGAVLALVGVAVASRPPAGASEIVFTQLAPYHPSAAPAVQRVSVPTAQLAPEGNWTPARGRLIAERALGWLNWPYSFDGGGAAGPTYGRAVDFDSRNDPHVLGFDCSGLVMYALAPWLSVDHSAAAQYSEAGTVHPGLADLQPGDLVFWSTDGTVAGIGHVAIYVGNGDVVQAPHSGAFIDVVPLDDVDSGRIGTTRPLT